MYRKLTKELPKKRTTKTDTRGTQKNRENQAHSSPSTLPNPLTNALAACCSSVLTPSISSNPSLLTGLGTGITSVLVALVAALATSACCATRETELRRAEGAGEVGSMEGGRAEASSSSSSSAAEDEEEGAGEPSAGTLTEGCILGCFVLERRGRGVLFVLGFGADLRVLVSSAAFPCTKGRKRNAPLAGARADGEVTIQSRLAGESLDVALFALERLESSVHAAVASERGRIAELARALLARVRLLARMDARVNRERRSLRPTEPVSPRGTEPGERGGRNTPG